MSLRQRVVTGVIAAPVALAGVFLLPPYYFSVFIAVVLLVAAWEWANLGSLAGSQRYVYATLVGLAMLGISFLPALPVLLLSLGWWLVLALMVILYPRLSDAWGRQALILMMGFLMLVPGWVALDFIKAMEHSSFLICLLFFLIWGADIGAYFAGKALGRHKLAPSVSPGKSWEGFVGGLVTVGVIALLMSLWFGAPLPGSGEGWRYLLAALLIGVVSVIGDLSISMFKRLRGVKDSSQLLPGHGGVLDRIDSLLSASPIFALYLMQAQWLQS